MIMAPLALEVADLQEIMSSVRPGSRIEVDRKANELEGAHVEVLHHISQRSSTAARSAGKGRVPAAISRRRVRDHYGGIP